MSIVKIVLTLFICVLSVSATAIKQLPEVTLKADDGGRLDGASWSSSEIKGKVTTLFYVDPDEKDLNNQASEALKKENFPLDRYSSIAVINMDATWLPNFAIENSLLDKQKQYPNTLYIKDFKKVLVKKWGFMDDSSNIAVFDPKGKEIFRIMGKATKEQISNMVSIIKEQITKLSKKD